MDIASVLNPQQIILDLKAATKEEALIALTDLLQQRGVLSDKEAFLEDVYQRESVSTTGIGNGIAIPHGKSKHVTETSVAIGRVQTGGLDWESFDDKPVTFVVLLAVNEQDKSGVHLKLLSQMARKLASEETCNRLTQATTPQQIIEIFSN